VGQRTSCTREVSYWTALRAVLSDEQLVELPMLVGNYVMMSYLLNALRVANDSGIELPNQPGRRGP
jgi:hypothetical protein